jgi:lipopolysaccharide/colanic/teichoic acid biosynthesis glycosyltransferase
MRLKRAVDVSVSVAALIALSPLLLALALAVLVGAGRPVFFTQTRVGRDFEPFRIWKFRTMRTGAAGPAITVAGDRRITRIGAFLRAAKLDELPQLWNVLKGDMSLVGPRPELPQYVNLFPERYARILTIRPGITDLASLSYRDEDALLARTADPLAEYVSAILPRKLDLAEEYLSTRSMALDCRVLFRTLIAILRRR